MFTESPGCGLIGPGFDYVQGKEFFFFLSKISRPTLDSTQPPMQWVLVTPSPKVKGPGREVNHSTRSSPTVDLYTLHGVSRSDFFSLLLLYL